MSQDMGAYPLVDPSRLCGLKATTVELAYSKRIDAIPAWKQITAGPLHQPPSPQQLKEMGREHCKSVLAALALLDPNQHTPAIDVRDLSEMISEARKPAPYATLNAALYLAPRAASRRRATSSGLKITGNFLGCGTSGICSEMSSRLSVTL